MIAGEIGKLWARKQNQTNFKNPPFSKSHSLYKN